MIIHGDCVEEMRKLDAASTDAIVTDPPYPEIKRGYGRMSEADWHTMMHEVVRQSRRVLKPHGSAVYILQPNSKKLGSMRAWLWEFMAWCCRDWNMVQDVWWWNHCTLPAAGANRKHGLLRGSIKLCLWLGDASCYRNQDAVLWEESDGNRANRLSRRSRIDARQTFPSGHSVNVSKARFTALERGGVTPFNLLPCNSASLSHGASTPLNLARWWIRYITKPGCTVLDSFFGAGTMGVAAKELGRNFVGIEREAEYVKIARKRLRGARQQSLAL